MNGNHVVYGVESVERDTNGNLFGCQAGHLLPVHAVNHADT